LLTLESLKEKCKVIPFALIRNTIDVWISRGMPEIEAFSTQYLNYLNAIKENNIKIFKYEDFCTDPQSVMQEICNFCKLENDSNFTKNYLNFTKVNGDVQTELPSRGAKHNEIVLLPRKRIPEKKIREIEKCKTIQIANQINGYSSQYDSAKLHKRNIFRRIFSKHIMDSTKQ